MASGNFNITRTSGSTFLTFPVEWSSKSNGTTANSSDVTVKVYVVKSSSSTSATYGSANTTVKVGTASQSNNGLSFSVSPGAKVLLFSKTFSNISHNSDGSKSVTISVTVGGNVMGASGSDTVTLDVIPRYATITSAPDFTDEGNNPTIYYSNPAGTAVTKLQACISLDGSAANISYRDISKTGTSYTFELTEAEKNTLRWNTKSGRTSRTVYFYIATYIGDDIYTDRIAKTFTVVNCKPTLSPTAIDVGGRSTLLTGNPDAIINGFNSIEVTMGAAAVKGASIVEQSITCGNQSFSGDSWTFYNVTTPTFTFYAKDDRGQEVRETITKDVFINYTRLTCGLNINAPDADGNLRFSIVGDYFAGTFGNVENTLAVEYRYKTGEGDYPVNDNGEAIWIAATPTITDNRYAATIDMSGLDYQSTYTFQARAADAVYYDYVETSEHKVKTTPIFDWGEEDFNFNVPVTIEGRKYGENKVLWSGGLYMTANQSITLSEPVSAQPHGIVLVFSLYDKDNTTVKDASFNTFFVSKKQVELFPNCGHTFIMAINAGFSVVGAKYLYFTDTSITGHLGNYNISTNSGITFDTTQFVLRYVIGV